MKTLETMTKDEKSLLLFFETQAVDYGGKIDTRHMNQDDFAIVKQWASEKFVNFGRIKFHSIENNRTNWVELSDEAWTLAHQERRNRCNRIMQNQPVDKIGVN